MVEYFLISNQSCSSYLKLLGCWLGSIINTHDPKALPQKVNTVRLLPYTERNPDLDYLSQVVQQESGGDTYRPTTSIFSKPYGQFDGLDSEYMYQDFLTPVENAVDNHNPPPISPTCSEQRTEAENSKSPKEMETVPFRSSIIMTSSPTDSESKEVYDYLDLATPKAKPFKTAVSRDPYLLRSRENLEAVACITKSPLTLADKLMNWSLALTEVLSETPQAVKFLRGLVEKLD